MVPCLMVRGTRAAEPQRPYGGRETLESESHDQVVQLSGVSWSDYERIDALRQDSSVPRLTYVEGVLELTSPGTMHESDKKKLARIVEAYLEHLGVPAEGVGSWTVKNKKKKLGGEPDECYVFTTELVTPSLKAPDLVIEVVYSSGSLDKLDLWRKLGAREVWFWHRSELAVFVRRGDAFSAARRSVLAPEIDLDLVVRCMRERTQTAAVRALRAALARKKS
jgi:Uma2 family endonuclease